MFNRIEKNRTDRQADGRRNYKLKRFCERSEAILSIFKNRIDCHGFCKASQKRMSQHDVKNKNNSVIARNEAGLNDEAIQKECSFLDCRVGLCPPRSDVKRGKPFNLKTIQPFNPITGQCAFTLAEVLITLGIIGIVAALTIPTLMNDINDNELKTAWKKAFSELSQANQQIIQDNGGVDFTGQCGLWGNACFQNLFATKIKVLKSSPNAVSSGLIVSDSKYQDGSTLQALPNVDINTFNIPVFLTVNGYTVKFRYHDIDCSMMSGQPYECGWMQVDVNGLKKPNIVGKDIFFVWLSKNKLFPAGAKGDFINPKTDCAIGGTGRGCAAKYLYE